MRLEVSALLCAHHLDGGRRVLRLSRSAVSSHVIIWASALADVSSVRACDGCKNRNVRMRVACPQCELAGVPSGCPFDWCENRNVRMHMASLQCELAGVQSGFSFHWCKNRNVHIRRASLHCALAGVSSGCSFDWWKIRNAQASLQCELAGVPSGCPFDWCKNRNARMQRASPQCGFAGVLSGGSFWSLRTHSAHKCAVTSYMYEAYVLQHRTDDAPSMTVMTTCGSRRINLRS